jgi:hypothetical protein
VDIKHLNRTEEYKKECHICHVKVQQVHEGTRRSAIFAMLKVQQVHGYKGVRYRYLNRTEEYLLVHFCTIGSARYAAFLLTYLSFFFSSMRTYAPSIRMCKSWICTRGSARYATRASAMTTRSSGILFMVSALLQFQYVRYR